jgi:glutamate racemase
LEIEKFFPHVKVVQEACPMWVPLVENNEHMANGADYFIEKHIDQVLNNHPDVDTLLLACTHYPLLMDKIQRFLPGGVQLLSQADIVATSLKEYLQRHTEIENRLSKEGQRIFYTTDEPSDFDAKATTFFGESVSSIHADILV